MALASAELPVEFTATLCAFTKIVKAIRTVMIIILRTVVNRTILFINNYFMNQKYRHDQKMIFKYYSKAVGDYCAEKGF
jgi:hypothetical protein